MRLLDGAAGGTNYYLALQRSQPNFHIAFRSVVIMGSLPPEYVIRLVPLQRIICGWAVQRSGNESSELIKPEQVVSTNSSLFAELPEGTTIVYCDLYGGTLCL